MIHKTFYIILALLVVFSCNRKVKETLTEAKKEDKINEIREKNIKTIQKIKYEYKYDVIDGIGKIIREMKYDTLGRLQSMYAGADFFRKTSTFEYDDKGNVIKRYDTDQKKGETTKTTIHYKYDKKDNLSEQIMYDEEGRINGRITYKYDKKGNVIETITYKEDGSVSHRNESVYNRKGHRTQYITYDLDSKLVMRYDFEYNENGNVILKQSFNADSALINKTEYEYGESGKKVKELQYDKNGNLEEKRVFEYNDKGMVEDETVYDENDKAVITYKYGYDYYVD
jgi:hypothetical protein